MDSIDNTIEYHELIMGLDNLDFDKEYELPSGYSFEFWENDEDLESWLNIHIETGEFNNREMAKNIFHDFYDAFASELTKRCFFIVNERGEKIATSTISPADENGYKCVIDWFGVAKSYQGKGLSKPLLLKTLQTAKKLGYDKILLHTQTTTWLAAKIYLDFGFKPINTEDEVGWKILKTLTNHPVLKDVKPINKKEIYSELMINVKNELDKLFDEYNFSVWYINNRNDVYVHTVDTYYEFKFFDNGKTLIRIK